MGANNVVIVLPINTPVKILKWKVSEGNVVSVGRVILLYDSNAGEGKTEPKKLKATQTGTVLKLLAAEGETINPGEPLFELGRCCHPTVMKDMCAECGADLRMDNYDTPQASVPMVHSVPELKVSMEQAQVLGQADEDRLLKERKLVLMVDLDQTLIHTTNDDVLPNLKDVHHFQLDAGSPWYHTRLRPGTHKFLENMSKLYELHICTFGSRRYAHAIAAILDCSKKFFSHRILSRDECFNPNTKTANLKALFPLGDNLVCIIDDREDVWNHAPNLVHVRPYHFFQHTGDINAPPCLSENYSFEEGSSVFTNEGNSMNQGESQVKKSINADAKKENVEDEENNTFLGQEDCLEELDINAKPITSSKVTEDAGGDAESKTEEIASQKNFSFKDEGGGQESEKKIEDISEKEDGVTASKVEAKESSNSGSKQSEEVVPKSENEGEVQTKELTQDVLLELDDHDDYLLHLEDILGTIHQAFYQIYDQSPDIPDMKSVVPYVRRKVLQGVHLCFSGVVPIGVPLEASRVYSVARSLGAEVSNELVLDEEIYSCADEENSREENSSEEVKCLKRNKERISKSSGEDEPVSKRKSSRPVNKSDSAESKKATTHLVAARLGTYKVNQAKRVKGSNLHIVTPDWLWCCAERWERVDERLFPLNRSTSADSTRKFKNIFGEVQPRPKDSEDSVKAGVVDGGNAQEDTSAQENNTSTTPAVPVSVNNDTSAAKVSAFATYDPVTGKRVRKETAATGVNDGKPNVAAVEERRRTPSGRFMDTINPLLSFSSEDLANMEDEVEEGLFDEEDETESDIEGLKQEEEGLDFDFKQSKKIEEKEMGFLGNGGKNNRKRKSSYISSEKEGIEEGEITKHFSTEDKVRDWDHDESVEMDDGEEEDEDDDDDDDKDWSMMGAALEREIMADEIE